MGYRRTNDDWGIKDWAGLANTAMNVQNFVNGQEDREREIADYNEKKQRGLQYDQALGALQSGQGLPQGISPGVGLQARQDFASAQADTMANEDRIRKIDADGRVRTKANKILTAWASAVKQNGPQAGDQVLRQLNYGTLEDARAAALVQEKLLQNQEFQKSRFDNSRAIAKRDGEMARQGIVQAGNLWKMGDKRSAIEVLSKTINQARLGYSVKQDGERFDIYHTDENGEKIKVANDISFEQATHAVTQALPTMALQVAEQNNRISKANANAWLGDGIPMVNVQTGQPVQIIKQVAKDDPNKTRYFVFDQQGVLQGGYESAEAVRRAFKPRKDEAVPSPHSKTSLGATRKTWKDSFMASRGYSKRPRYNEATGVTETVYLDSEGNPPPAGMIQRAENVLRQAEAYMQHNKNIGRQRALELAEQDDALYTAAVQEFTARNPSYRGKHIPNEKLRPYIDAIRARRSGTVQVDRSGWTPQSVTQDGRSQAPLKPGYSTPSAVPYGGLQTQGF